MTSAVSNAVPRLHRRVLWTQLACLLVMLMGAALLAAYVDATLVGIAPEVATTYRHPVLFGAGILFVVFGAWGALRTGRHAQHLLLLVSQEQPQPMYVRLRVEEGDDSTTYYALLSISEAAAPVWKVQLWFSPSKALADRLGETALLCAVYVCSGTEHACVVEVEGEVLWPFSGGTRPLMAHAAPRA